MKRLASFLVLAFAILALAAPVLALAGDLAPPQAELQAMNLERTVQAEAALENCSRIELDLTAIQLPGQGDSYVSSETLNSQNESIGFVDLESATDIGKERARTGT